MHCESNEFSNFPSPGNFLFVSMIVLIVFLLPHSFPSNFSGTVQTHESQIAHFSMILPTISKPRIAFRDEYKG